jgi:hypothetical protein
MGPALLEGAQGNQSNYYHLGDSMNEQIQELWRDCVLKHTKNPMNWQTVADEFALLIVLKCAEIADTAEPFLASDLIKQHFGVEE